MISNFELLKKRAEINQSVRNFFTSLNFLEVETPILSPDVIPESHIELFKTTMVSSYKDEKKDFYLLPSPELWMKKLIAQGIGNIFQICKCFRNSEQTGRQHSPEFSMLEYYAMYKDYNYSLKLTKALFQSLFEAFRPEYNELPWNVISVRDAVCSTTGIDIYRCRDVESLRSQAIAHGFDVSKGYDTWEEIFNRIFIERTEIDICSKGITVLMDYPVQIPCLARKKLGTPYYERWEMYIDGIEIANCYTEEPDADAVRGYYRQESEAKNKCAIVPVDVDMNFPDIFHSFPHCSGTALGMDRLVMILTGERDISNVISIH
ncbi:MAG: elongation factor P--(R)-beta-lysine ligase [Spirochaetia bacterium]|nr:elongation factor P--(R)-beta-lysine ligase [Spirochaetia bacterium]